MPLEAPSAPWESSASDTGSNATAEATSESKPSASTQPNAPVSRESDPDFKAYKAAQKSEKVKESEPAAKSESQRSEAEATDKETPSESGEPVKIEFTPKAKKYAEELGVTEDNALDKALSAYERTGLFTDEELLEKSQKNFQSFLEQGLKLAKNQRDTDKLYGKAQRGDAEQQQTQDEGQPEELLPIPEAVKKVMDEAFEPLANDEYLKDFVAPLGIAFTTVAEQLGKHYAAELNQTKQAYAESTQQLQQQLSNLSGAMVDMKLERERVSLVEKYPTLKDNAVNERVLKMYDTLATSGEFKTPEDAYRKAVSAELGEETTMSLKMRMLTEQKNRKSGQPKVPGASQTEDRKPTPEEVDRMAFARAMKQNNRKY